MAEEAAEANAAKGGGSQMKLVMVMIVGAILLVAVSMGGVFFLMKSMGMMNPGGGAGGGHVRDENAPALYFPLEPAFVVNFKERGRTRFLQVEIQVMSRDQMMLDELQKHMPVIRNNLLLLFSGQTAETLNSVEGKEQLRQQALNEINKLLEEELGQVDAIEALYFTSFVTQ
jgi:flagellar FliL protein